MKNIFILGGPVELYQNSLEEVAEFLQTKLTISNELPFLAYEMKTKSQTILFTFAITPINDIYYQEYKSKSKTNKFPLPAEDVIKAVNKVNHDHTLFFGICSTTSEKVHEIISPTLYSIGIFDKHIQLQQTIFRKVHNIFSNQNIKVMSVNTNPFVHSLSKEQIQKLTAQISKSSTNLIDMESAIIALNARNPIAIKLLTTDTIKGAAQKSRPKLPFNMLSGIIADIIISIES